MRIEKGKDGASMSVKELEHLVMALFAESGAREAFLKGARGGRVLVNRVLLVVSKQD